MMLFDWLHRILEEQERRVKGRRGSGIIAMEIGDVEKGYLSINLSNPHLL